jgi:hypothetical protein
MFPQKQEVLGRKYLRLFPRNEETPQVFTLVFQTVIAHLHTLSVQAHSYLDDSLLKEFDSEILSRHTCLFIRLLLDLGFLISWKKSQILPSQDFLFLGEHYRTDLGLIFPPEEKFQSLVQIRMSLN